MIKMEWYQVHVLYRYELNYTQLNAQPENHMRGCSTNVIKVLDMQSTFLINIIISLVLSPRNLNITSIVSDRRNEGAREVLFAIQILQYNSLCKFYIMVSLDYSNGLDRVTTSFTPFTHILSLVRVY